MDTKIKTFWRNQLGSFDAAILANGDFPQCSLPLETLYGAPMLACCDEALLTLLDHNPQEVKQRLAENSICCVGDGDSLPEELKEKYRHIMHHFSEQDYNDLTKATKYLTRWDSSIHIIAYIGATGKREDHALSNIALMAWYRKHIGIEPVMLTDYGIFTAHEGDSEFKTFPRQQMSIFNLSCHRLESEGLVWSSYPYEELWQGSLNCCKGSHVEFHADGEYLVFRTYEPKE